MRYEMANGIDLDNNLHSDNKNQEQVNLFNNKSDSLALPNAVIF